MKIETIAEIHWVFSNELYFPRISQLILGGHFAFPSLQIDEKIGAKRG